MGNKSFEGKLGDSNLIVSIIRTSFLRVSVDMDETAVIEHSKEVVRRLTGAREIIFKRFYENKGNAKFAHRFVEILAAFLKSNRDLIDLIDNVEKQKQFRQKISPELSLWLSFQVMNIVCWLRDKRTLYSLYEEAKRGNTKSLFKLLRYDKTLFDHEWLREMIFKEALLGNDDFFSHLGNAIRKKAEFHGNEDSGWKIVVIFFWQGFFSKMDEGKQMDIVQRCGVKIPNDPAKYHRSIQTEIKPFFE